MSKKRGIWLIDKLPYEDFLGARLPSKEQVLLVFIHHHKEIKETLSEAAKSTSTKLQVIWKRANIPVKTEENIRAGIQKLYKEYQSLGKDKSRNSEAANRKRQEWKSDLDKLFDIASQNVMTMSSVLQKDKEFLIMQRDNRMSSSMSGIDKKHSLKIAEKIKKQEKFDAFKKKHYKEIEESNIIAQSEQNPALSLSSDEDDEFTAPSVSATPAKVPRLISSKLRPLDRTLTATWDREKLSNRQASTSFIATAKSLGHDVSDISISPSTVYRARVANRTQMAKDIEKSLFENPPPLVLHWDSKLLPSVTSINNLEDRVAVFVTGKNFEHLLGVPVAAKGTGEEMAKVVLKEVDKFDVRRHIIGICFDTTASNTGLSQGACVRIENDFKRILLWLACRHHTHELILKGVFDECYPVPSSAPDIKIFRKFQNMWDSLDKTVYTTMLDEEDSMQGFLKDQRMTMIHYLQNTLENGTYPREDYKELLQLSLLYLGGWSQNYFPFRVPGALHQARWMAKAIYALKIVLFTQQLLNFPGITKKELSGMKQIGYFVCLVYVRFWHESVISRWAPKNDLDMIQILDSYPDINVKKSALAAAKRHLWYLSEINIGLAFLDERITQEEKNKMFLNLEKPAKKKEMKRLDGKTLKFDEKSISDFVTSKTKTFFELFGIHDKSEYCSTTVRDLVDGLKVVNDTAERGIALIKKFNDSVKDEEQKQFLLRVVEHHRRGVTKRTKEEVAAYIVN